MSGVPGGLAGLRVAWPDARVLVADRDWLVIDKPHGLPVHGGGPGRGGDVVSRLAAWLAARGEPERLGVHQRLDQDASGLLIFTRSGRADGVLGQQMRARRVRRGYVAAVRDPGLPDEGELSDRLQAPERGPTLVVRSGGKPALTRFRVVRRARHRALVELHPVTGRRHQLRAQLAHAGAPIAGDALYGGRPAARLWLHASVLEVPALGCTWSSPPPAGLQAWVEGREPALPRGGELEARLADAGARRWPLGGVTTAWRLVDGAADDVPGAVVDVYGEWAVLVVTTPEADRVAAEIARALARAGARGVYLKRRLAPGARADAASAPPEPLCGEPAPSPLEVVEGDLRLLVRLGEGFGTGLFVDQRDSRARVRQRARGARVLNLFAHTASFSVAAALGGAATTLGIDLSRSALGRARENLALNGADPRVHHLLRAEVSDWLRRARRRGGRDFDLVVLDPPSFSAAGRGGRRFTVERDYARLAADALGLLARGGALFAITHHRGTSQAALRRLLHEAGRAAGRRLTLLRDLAPPLDCRGGTEHAKGVLVEVA